MHGLRRMTEGDDAKKLRIDPELKYGICALEQLYLINDICSRALTHPHPEYVGECMRSWIQNRMVILVLVRMQRSCEA